MGTNFAFYPQTVTEVVAVEPEPHLALRARAAGEDAPIPVTVTADTAEQFSDQDPFDAVVCSLVLCSVTDQLGCCSTCVRCCARAGVALPRTHRQCRRPWAAAAICRRDLLAPDCRKLPHAS
ncbi:methyltransferase domain protein [Mycobacterium ulcerans str. Harvey]|uniref:Methyltransferase domain protein n=1 Tax=Mycobacterium ulcerans str. Harvey TaxID=1299332 RepID=A0ABP3AKX8_MYCUL|nr:methyltransferase domain protein [Mycobacterium ulcerans str. Harvey]